MELSRRYIAILVLWMLALGGVPRVWGQEAPAEGESPTQTLKGVLIDAQTQQPIAGGTVRVIGTRLGGYSGRDGSYRVANVPVGRQTIRISAVGYEPFTADLIVTSGRQAVLDAELREAVARKEEVVVTGGKEFRPINEAALVSSNAFSLDDVKRFAGSREDPARMAANFAGVLGTSSTRNDIIIRGGSPTELLWRLDGIDIPNPNHFATQGATGGPVNAINANVLANSDFMTGAFPAEYGTKLSGVFDLRTRRGNTERYEFVGQMGFNGFEGMAEGPFPGVRGGSFIAGYRKSTIQILDALGISIGFAAIPKFEDATVKMDLPITDRDNIAVLGLGGISNIAIDQSAQDSVFTGDRDIDNGTDLGVLGVSWQRLFSDNLVGKLTVSTVQSRYHTDVDSLTTDTLNHVLASSRWFESASTEAYTSVRYRLAYTPAEGHYITLGAEARRLTYDLDEHRITPRADNGVLYKVQGTGSTEQGLGFINWNWRPAEALTVNAGVHAQYLGISRKFSLEPRLAASLAVGGTQTFNLGFGVHRQAQPLLVYFRDPANNGLDFTQSVHYVAGYTNQLASDLLVKVEGYYKRLTNVPVERDSVSSYSLLNAGASFGSVSTIGPLLNDGTGKAYGAELSVIKHFGDGYYTTITGSLFRQKYAGSDGIERNGAYDNRYIVNLLAGYEWTVNPSFTIEFSGKFTVAGGAPYTPVDLQKSRLYGNTTVDNLQRYSLRDADYQRLDVRADFRNNFGTWALIGYFSVENLLGRKNIQDRIYNRRFDRIDEVYQLGLFPIGGIRVEF